MNDPTDYPPLSKGSMTPSDWEDTMSHLISIETDPKRAKSKRTLADRVASYVSGKYHAGVLPSDLYPSTWFKTLREEINYANTLALDDALAEKAIQQAQDLQALYDDLTDERDKINKVWLLKSPTDPDYSETDKRRNDLDGKILTVHEKLNELRERINLEIAKPRKAFANTEHLKQQLVMQLIADLERAELQPID